MISFNTGLSSMKSSFAIFSLVLALLTSTAISQSTSPQVSGKREVVLWGLSLGPETKGQDAVIREFERRNPDIKVKLLSMGAGRMDPQKLMTSIVGNVAPDVINQDRFTISDWASRGAFRSLNDLIERDHSSDKLCPTEKQYYPAPWQEATYLGQVYAIPTSSDNRILYWNKKIFREESANLKAAGLDPERAPRTWTELLAYSRVLTKIDKSGKLVRAGFMPNFGNSWLYMYAFQNNANFLSADGRTCTMNTPEAVEALDYIVKGYEIVGGYEKAKSFESGFQGKENDCFIVGQVAMKIDGDWILNGLARYAPELELHGDPAPVPDDRYNHKGRFANEKDTNVTWMGGFSLAIPKGAKNPEDGWKLIKFMTSTEGRLIENHAQAAWERMRGRVFIPRQIANIEANETSAKTFKPASENYAEAIEMHTKMARFGRIRPATFAGQVLWTQHVKAMEDACYKKSSSTKALQEAQLIVQGNLDDFYNKSKFPVLNLQIPAFLGILALLGFIGYFIFQFTKARIGKLERHEAKWAYLFVSPWVLGFLMLTIGPMIASLFFSFTQWDVLNEARFVGLKNYQDMFGADWKAVSTSLGNVAYLTGVGVPLGLTTGLAIALLLNTASKGIRFYRTIFYMPSIIPVIASAVLWTWVLTADPGKGLINSYWVETLTKWLHVDPPAWLNSSEWSKPALILQGVWGAGGGMVLWLAGLKGVPMSLYEAAGIDGANGNRQFWSITFPQLSPIIFFNLVTGFIGSMQEFDRVYVMRPSLDGPIGPADSLLTPAFHLFNNGFAFFKMGYASALAWLIFGLVMIVTFIQWKLKDRWVHTEVSS